MYNFSTGPVDLHPAVVQALGEPPISHRSPEGMALLQTLAKTLSQKVGVQETFVVTGSGTLVNEVMLWQIKQQGGTGLIFSNGEFGERLRDQADRINLPYTAWQQEWGTALDLDLLREKLRTHQPAWLLCCHCETSTGLIQPLRQMVDLCQAFGCQVFVDCMSTFGAMPLSLAGVAMATASSSKGVGALAGLGLVFSNLKIMSPAIHRPPKYLDLAVYQQYDGVPFTISCNLARALLVAVNLNMNNHRWQELEQQSRFIYEFLQEAELLAVTGAGSPVMTLAPKTGTSLVLGEAMEKQGISLSFRSQYLQARNWLQVALFGQYSPDEIAFLVETLQAETRMAKPQRIIR